MSCQVQLGHVESLYPHVKEDWWKGAFNELYLRTDGDVVEDPAITEAECKDMLDIQAVASIFGRTSQAAGENCSGKNVETTIRVLDLCCGQGRHSIYLAKKYPSVEFHGLDQSLYLINLAKERAKEDRCQNILFNVGDARHIPDEDNTFDLVILMGNSFGVYSEENDNARLLEDVARVLKPGGALLVDLVSANYTKSSFCPGGWEWINGGKVSDPYTKGTMGQAEYRKLIACRERQLSSDGKWLASRELVIDLEDGIHQDLFYKLRLYELDEMELLLEDCGLSLNKKDSRELFGPTTERNDDLGMMAARHLLVAEKTKVLEDPEAMRGTGMAFYLHPSLVIDTDAIKGRMIRVTAGVKAGTLLMVDNPYALVPDITPGSGDFLPCSRLE
jgi:SAM-dependent methyltransferase